MLFTPLKVAVAIYAIGTTATELTCWPKNDFKGPISGTYTLNSGWQNARNCQSARWSTGTNNPNCIWIKGSSGQKSWSARTNNFPTDIFKDIGYDSQVREAAC
ncbi:hypothetical protein V499_07373 [Pseudogymnoascus sp. VKM F-103]|nr:hypothetical protein V499_07373 [Pseudogymnoascus sp. VKM F-103]